MILGKYGKPTIRLWEGKEKNSVLIAVRFPKVIPQDEVHTMVGLLDGYLSARYGEQEIG